MNIHLSRYFIIKRSLKRTYLMFLCQIERLHRKATTGNLRLQIYKKSRRFYANPCLYNRFFDHLHVPVHFYQCYEFQLFDSVSASIEVGKLSEKAAHLKTIPELADYKKGDELADRLGTVYRVFKFTNVEQNTKFPGIKSIFMSVFKLLFRHGESILSWRPLVNEYPMEARRWRRA